MKIFILQRIVFFFITRDSFWYAVTCVILPFQSNLLIPLWTRCSDGTPILGWAWVTIFWRIWLIALWLQSTLQKIHIKEKARTGPGYNDLERCYLWASGDFADNKLPLALFGGPLVCSFRDLRGIDEEFIERNREPWNSASRPNSDEPRVSRSANYSAVREAAVYQTRPRVRTCMCVCCRSIEDRLVDLLNCRVKREKKREREKDLLKSERG